MSHKRCSGPSAIAFVLTALAFFIVSLFPSQPAAACGRPLTIRDIQNGIMPSEDNLPCTNNNSQQRGNADAERQLQIEQERQELHREIEQERQRQEGLAERQRQVLREIEQERQADRQHQLEREKEEARQAALRRQGEAAAHTAEEERQQALQHALDKLDITPNPFGPAGAQNVSSQSNPFASQNRQDSGPQLLHGVTPQQCSAQRGRFTATNTAERGPDVGECLVPPLVTARPGMQPGHTGSNSSPDFSGVVEAGREVLSNLDQSHSSGSGQSGPVASLGSQGMGASQLPARVAPSGVVLSADDMMRESEKQCTQFAERSNERKQCMLIEEARRIMAADPDIAAVCAQITRPAARAKCAVDAYGIKIATMRQPGATDKSNCYWDKDGKPCIWGSETVAMSTARLRGLLAKALRDQGDLPAADNTAAVKDVAANPPPPVEDPQPQKPLPDDAYQNYMNGQASRGARNDGKLGTPLPWRDPEADAEIKQLTAPPGSRPEEDETIFGQVHRQYENQQGKGNIGQ